MAEKRTLVSTVEEEKIKNEDAAKRLEESRKVVEDNNHGKLRERTWFQHWLTYLSFFPLLYLVIEWLHRQLNEEALGRPLGTATGAHVLGGLSGAVAGTGGFVGTIDFDKYNTNTNNNANVSSIPVNEV